MNMLVLLRYVVHLLLGLAAFLCLTEWCAQATVEFPFWIWLLSVLMGCWLLSIMVWYRKERGRLRVRSLMQTAIHLLRALSRRWRYVAGLALLIFLFSTILTACLLWAAGGLISLLQALHLVVLLMGFFASTALLGLAYERPASSVLPAPPPASSSPTSAASDKQS